MTNSTWEPRSSVRWLSNSDLPPLLGARIAIRFGENLYAWRGRLLEAGAARSGRGVKVHAASLIRRRQIVLDRALLAEPGELRRILIHELLHFAWVRLGNPARAEWAAVIEAEFSSRARGELGWSSELRKIALPFRNRGRLWREYLCESFCDTGSFLYARASNQSEFTLAPRFAARRARWFAGRVARGPLSI